MRKNNLTRFLIFGIVIMLFGCNAPEDILEKETNSLKLTTLNSNEIKKRKKLFSKIENFSEFSKLQILNKTENSENYDFSVETNSAKMLQNGTITSYTFKVKREENNGLLENLLITEKQNGVLIAQLLQYNLTENEKTSILSGGDVNVNGKLNIIDIDDPILISNVMGKYSTDCFDTIFIYSPPRSCLGQDHHLAGDTDCPYWFTDPSMAASYGGYESTVVSVPCVSGGGGDDTGGGIITTPTGGGSSTDIDLELPPDPCEKVKALFAKLPTLHEELSTLSGQTSELTERGRFKVTTANTIQTPSSNTNGEIIFDPYNNNAVYTMMGHTHNSPANNTYSVFSWADLENLASLVRNGSVDTNNFVSFLATADGTYYAFTIENPDAFAQFFATRFDPDFDLQIATKKSEQMKKYYFPSNGGNPLIKENNTDNIADQKAFLDLMNDNNLGTSLFESNSTFTTFDKVMHNKITNSVDKQPCN